MLKVAESLKVKHSPVFPWDHIYINTHTHTLMWPKNKTNNIQNNKTFRVIQGESSAVTTLVLIYFNTLLRLTIRDHFSAILDHASTWQSPYFPFPSVIPSTVCFVSGLSVYLPNMVKTTRFKGCKLCKQFSFHIKLTEDNCGGSLLFPADFPHS